MAQKKLDKEKSQPKEMDLGQSEGKPSEKDYKKKIKQDITSAEL
eukprot:CAMPEP_0170544992 /NCGR_PEP_ID=MMETSP0211-20121228/3549_1 /TAXON_ID=311385 /ORGANISM="Pseudokeronopsis sp., Strain OXSARD2" /LENGTH=43 /DNA_ID= /DNA_START= /DNA_END= /DNA_ORIENTATION=